MITYPLSGAAHGRGNGAAGSAALDWAAARPRADRR